MSNKLIIECDGKRYCAKPELMSVHGDLAIIAVKGGVPIYLPIIPIDTTANEDQETVADVVSDIRKRAENAHDAFLNDPDETVHHEAVSEMLVSLADRIEAAYNNMKAGGK